MKKAFIIIIIIVITACDNSTNPVLSPNPLNGKWNSVKQNEAAYFIPVEMQLLEVLQYKDGICYGGIVSGSGGFEYGHFWIEFEITTGITDRVSNSIRFTFQTQTIVLNGFVMRTNGNFDGKIINESRLVGNFQLVEIGRTFELTIEKR